MFQAVDVQIIIKHSHRHVDRRARRVLSCPHRLLARVDQRGGRRGGGSQSVYAVDVTMKLDSLIATADEAVQVAAALETRVRENFAEGYEVEMTLEPVAAQAEEGLSGGLFSDDLDDGSGGQTAASAQEAEAFYTGFRIARTGR